MADEEFTTMSGGGSVTGQDTEAPSTDAELNSVLGDIGASPNNPQNADYPTQEQEEAQKQSTEQPVVQEEQKEMTLEEIMNPQQTTQTPETPQQTETPSTVKTFTEEEYNTALAEVAKKYESIQATIQELETNPYNFASKYLPHLFENFDEGKYVSTKMQEQFGDFKPDANRALVYGTRDWQYKDTQDKLIKEARDLATQSVSSLKEQETQAQQEIEQFKTAKMTELGLAPDVFNPLWDKINTLSSAQVLDIVISSFLDKSSSATVRENIQKNIDRAKEPPPPTSVSHGAPTDKEDPLIGLFGKPEPSTYY